MVCSKHAIERYVERITPAPIDVIEQFILKDLIDSECLYRIGNIEKRYKNGIVYVLDHTEEAVPTVVTLYIQFK